MCRVYRIGAEEPPLGGPVPGMDHVFRSVGFYRFGMSRSEERNDDRLLVAALVISKGQDGEHVLLPRNNALGLSAKSPDGTEGM